MEESDKLYLRNSVEVEKKDDRKQSYLLLWLSSYLLKIYSTENRVYNIMCFYFSMQKFWGHQ